MQIERGSLINHNAARPLVPLIDGWRKAVFKYIDNEPGDPPYLYNERANVSLLSAGAWLNNFIAIEEYISNKGRGKEQKRGRPDLYVRMGKYVVSIEAKQEWTSAAWRLKTLKNHVEASIESAVCDVKKVNERGAKFGICFYAVGFPANEFRDFEKSSDQYILTELERFTEIGQMDFWAWCFSKKERREKIEETKNDKTIEYYYPGIILGGKSYKA